MPKTMILFVATAFSVACVPCSSQVKVSTGSYCCESPKLQYNHMCEVMWTVHNKNFAHFVGTSTDCTSPCRNIEHGLMVMDSCVAVNVTIMCTKGSVIEEENVYYYGRQCSPSLLSQVPSGQQGSISLLLVVLIGGWLLKQIMG